MASGFNTPVHCCFDDDGYCYVVESGHKIDAVPRILKVDPQTGAWETFFTLPEDKWIKGAVETPVFKKSLICGLLVGLDTAYDASTAGFATNAQPSAQRENAYSTNGCR